MNEINNLSGPVFTPGPGWGAKTGRWLDRYFLKAVLPVAAVLLIIYATAARAPNRSENLPEQSSSPTAPGISLQINRGDSRILLARRALTEYLIMFPETLTRGQKLFIETALGQNMPGAVLRAGETIDINVDDLQTAIAQAKQLTQFQREQWETLAKNVRF